MEVTDREKIIKGLECCISGNPAICKRVGCPYAEEHEGIGDTCIDHLMADALALLKAQEPVEPNLDVDEWRCGNCGHKLEHQELLGDNVLFHEQYNYCLNCGAKMDGDANE